MRKKIMTDKQALDFASLCHRAEWEENKRAYTKALRASLIALGFDEDWVNGRFRDLIEEWHRLAWE